MFRAGSPKPVWPQSLLQAAGINNRTQRAVDPEALQQLLLFRSPLVAYLRRGLADFSRLARLLGKCPGEHGFCGAGSERSTCDGVKGERAANQYARTRARADPH